LEGGEFLAALPSAIKGWNSDKSKKGVKVVLITENRNRLVMKEKIDKEG